MEKIDLVVLKDGEPLRPLEVKLTVVPDGTTAAEDEADWGPEMVVRPVSSAYAMMNLAHRLRKSEHRALRRRVERSLRDAYSNVRGWDNPTEIISHQDQLIKALADAMKLAYEVQEPYLLQPIWRTEGQSLKFCERCFDVFVWSDAAVMEVPLKRLHKSKPSKKVSRLLREAARHVKAFYEACSLGHFNYRDTYGGMDLENQTDKSFSIAGKTTRAYLNHRRLRKPYYPKGILSELVLDGGEKMLRPERRFDAAVVSQI